MKHKVVKNFGNIIFFVIVLMILVFVGQIASGKVPEVFGYKLFRVVSQSMRPTIPDETCIIVKKVAPEDLKKGDIITFISKDPSIYGYYNTHRIVDIVTNETTGEQEYVTQGDANPTPDVYHVGHNDLAGKYVGLLPFGTFFAKAVIALSNQKIYFLVVMVPLMLCLFSYLKQLLQILMGKGDENDQEDNEKTE